MTDNTPINNNILAGVLQAKLGGLAYDLIKTGIVPNTPEMYDRLSKYAKDELADALKRTREYSTPR